MHKSITLVLAAILACAFASAAEAGPQQSVDIWIGGSGNWSNNANWSTGQVPNNGGGTFFEPNIISVPTSNVITFDAVPTTVDTLAVGAGQTLQDNGSPVFLTVGDATSPFSNSGELDNEGTINWGNGGILTVGASGGSSGQVNNAGGITISDATLQVNGNFSDTGGSGGLNVTSASEVNDTGAVSNATNVDVTAASEILAATFSNSGHVSIDADSAVMVTGTYANLAVGGSAPQTDITGVLKAGTYTQADGTTTVEKIGTLTATSLVGVGGGTLQGTGTINTPGLVMNGGTLVPGTSSAPGTLTLDGAFTQTGGTFEEEISASANGTLAVSGNVTLAPSANLSIVLENGFTPGIGQTFNILSSGAGPVSGNWGNAPQGFDTINGLTWDVSYGSTTTLTFNGIVVSSALATITLTGQTVTESPSGGTLTNQGTINLQGATQVTLAGNLTNQGTINTGNSVPVSGGNSLTVTGNLVNNGNILLSGPGDTLTTTGLTNTGSLVAGSGASLTINGNLNNSGSVIVNGGCTGCTNGFAPVTVLGGTTNTGTIEYQETPDEVLHAGLTWQDVLNVENSGQYGIALIDAFIVLGPTEVEESLPAGLREAAALPAPANFHNVSGGLYTLSGTGNKYEITNGSFLNDAGATAQVSGSNNVLIAADSFVNGGTVTLSGTGNEIHTPLFTNTGTLTIGFGDTVRIEQESGGPAVAYTQSAGATFVNGALISSVVDVTGGLLRGHGSISGALSNTGGTVAPGGTIGTLTVGSYSQGPGGTLSIEVSPTAASQLNSLGAASLAGTLALTFDPGVYGAHIYEIVAGAPVTGTFSTVTMSGAVGPGMVAGVTYPSNQVDLVIEPTAGAQAYGALSRATLNRATDTADIVEDSYDDAGCANGQVLDAKLDETACEGTRVWGQVVGASDHAGPADASFTNNSAGVIGGIDERWGDTGTLGVAAAYSANHLTMAAQSASASGQSTFGSVYGRLIAGGLLFDAQGFYMRSDWPLHRAIAGAGIVTSHPSGGTEGLLAQVSAPLADTRLRPYVRFTWAEFDRGATSETGAGPLGFAVKSGTATSTLGEAGIIFDALSFDAGGRPVLLSLRLGAQDDFSDRKTAIVGSLAGVGGTAFTVDTVGPDRIAGVVDATVRAGLTSDFDLTAQLRGRFGSEQSEGAATIGGVIRF